MRRRDILAGAGLAATGATLTFPAPAIAQGIRQLKMVTDWPDATPGIHPMAVRFAQTVSEPSRPGEFHPEPLADPDLTLSRHPARATARRLPPSIEYRVPPVAGLGSVLPVRIAFLAGLLLRKLRLFLITCVHH